LIAICGKIHSLSNNQDNNPYKSSGGLQIFKLNISMKKLIFIAFFIPCLIRKTYAQERDSSDFLMAIGVKSNLETIIAVDCEEFTNSFKNRLTYKGIFDKDTLLLFQKFVKHAHFRKENDVIDVRRKFILYEKYASDQVHIDKLSHNAYRLWGTKFCTDAVGGLVFC
jgi:hypothetical protein